jgi:hypothetical protein
MARFSCSARKQLAAARLYRLLQKHTGIRALSQHGFHLVLKSEPRQISDSCHINAIGQPRAAIGNS